MLSPAVRAAAHQHAINRGIVPTGGPIFKEVDEAYLVGYCAGARAPRAHRFPLAGDQQFKRLLGQYLAENITVYHPATGRYGLLRGLPACYEGQGEPLADVEFYADEEAREAGGGDSLDDVSRILPVLYSPQEGQHALADRLHLTVEQLKNTIAEVEEMAVIVDSYRALGIAVGLAPHQYHRRVAGFDYASGLSPEKCAGCERKEVCRG